MLRCRLQLKCDGTRWREGKWRGNWRMEWVASILHTTSELPLMRTPRLSVVDWTDAPADLNGLVRFAERRNLVSARVPSHFSWPLHIWLPVWLYTVLCAANCNKDRFRSASDWSVFQKHFFHSRNVPTRPWCTWSSGPIIVMGVRSTIVELWNSYQLVWISSGGGAHVAIKNRNLTKFIHFKFPKIQSKRVKAVIQQLRFMFCHYKTLTCDMFRLKYKKPSSGQTRGPN